MIEGLTENASKGGIGLISDKLIPTEALVRCEFCLLDSVIIPTLLKVRWCERVSGSDNYRIGMEFLI
jgi:hypothetical protein